MVFSSLLFLFLFLPVVLLANLAMKQRLQNYLLLAASWFFFAWGGVSYFLLLFFSILINYFVGLGIAGASGRKTSRLVLAAGLVINVGALLYFKYWNFILDNINHAMGSEGIEFSRVVLPIGISFFTFQAISYIVDVYRKKVPAQKNFFDLALYISLFPQLIAGPIVRYETIVLQLKSRKQGALQWYSGIKRFCLGMAKKVLIANQMAVIADWAFNADPSELSASAAWIGLLAYSLQIYFDFSGYSDMAIGLGRMLGFQFLENFNYPYIARTIKDFWRRWHISLSTWFRDYVYIPMGGNKNGGTKTYVNLLIVFVLTGFWHGASWNFLVWGLIHGALLMFERTNAGKKLQHLPRIVSHIYVLFFVMMAWVFFRSETIGLSWQYIQTLFGAGSAKLGWVAVSEYVWNGTLAVMVIAVLASTRFFFRFIKSYIKLWNNPVFRLKPVLLTLYHVATLVFVAGVLIVTSSYLVSSSYNPFIYFRF